MKNTGKKSRRLPAEWEEQDGVLLAWPHANTDWKPVLPLVEPVFAEIISAISRFEKVILIVPDDGSVKARLSDAGTDLRKITFVNLPTNDTWARDFGPITVFEHDVPVMLDFGFNGWGLKFPANHDNQANRLLASTGLFKGINRTMPLVLEGGSIESDGNGTLLVTAECLLNPNRNPHLTIMEIEDALREQLGAERFLWLNHGYLAGDDTDSHIDTLARLCPDDTILFVSCDDPADEHFEELRAMKRELESFRTAGNNPYRLIPLPFPPASHGIEGERIPATYANFLVINHAVLVPTYRDSSDEAALSAIREAFPGREIIGIDCRSIILQHGSLHCLTMQLPKGTLA
jgi:agmatine deiminase